MWKNSVSKVIAASVALLMLWTILPVTGVLVRASEVPGPEEIVQQETGTSSVGDRIYSENQNNQSNIDLNYTLQSCKGPLDNSSCLINMLINTIGLVFMLIGMLLGWIVDFVLFLVLSIIETIIKQNPTAQGSAFFDLAVQAYAITLSIGNLMILFSFFYVGYRYLFGLQDKKIGWQEFLIKVVAATILVNFSIFLVSIFVSILHDIGSLFVNIFGTGGGDIGGAYQNAIKSAGGYDAQNPSFTFGSIFSEPSKFYSEVLIKLLYPIIGVFIIMELFKMIKIVITRFVMLFLLLVVSPIAIVCYFSPIDVFRKQGQEWLKQLWVQTSLYPIFVIALAIGSVFIIGFADAANEESLGVGNEHLPRVMALLIAYGIIKVLVQFFEESFKGVAEGVWKQMGTAAMAVGGALGAAGSVALSAGRGALSGARSGAAVGESMVGNLGGAGSFRNKMLRASVGVATGTVGAGLGYVKGGLTTNPNDMATWTRRAAFGAGSMIDMLGNDSVERMSKQNKLFGAWTAQTQTEASNFGNYALRKSGQGAQVVNNALKSANPNLGTDLDFEEKAADIADFLMPHANPFLGELGSETGAGWARARGEGVKVYRSKMGINPNLSGKNVMKRLDRLVARGSAGSYNQNRAQADEVIDELVKRPSLVNQLTESQKKWLQQNHPQIEAARKADWGVKVEENFGHLAGPADARRAWGAQKAELQLDSPEFRSIDSDSWNDPEVMAGYLANFQGDKKELSKRLGRDFNTFDVSRDKDINGATVANSAVPAERITHRMVQHSAQQGLTGRTKSELHKAVEADLLAKTGGDLSKADDRMINDSFRDVSAGPKGVIRKNQFYDYTDRGHEVNQLAADAVSAVTADPRAAMGTDIADKFKEAVGKNPQGRKFVELWESENGRKMTNGDVDGARAQYKDIIQRAEKAAMYDGQYQRDPETGNVIVDTAGNPVPTPTSERNKMHEAQAEEFMANNGKFKRAQGGIQAAAMNQQTGLLQNIANSLASGGAGAAPATVSPRVSGASTTPGSTAGFTYVPGTPTGGTPAGTAPINAAINMSAPAGTVVAGAVAPVAPSSYAATQTAGIAQPGVQPINGPTAVAAPVQAASQPQQSPAAPSQQVPLRDQQTMADLSNSGITPPQQAPAQPAQQAQTAAPAAQPQASAPAAIPARQAATGVPQTQPAAQPQAPQPAPQISSTDLSRALSSAMGQLSALNLRQMNIGQARSMLEMLNQAQKQQDNETPAATRDAQIAEMKRMGDPVETIVSDINKIDRSRVSDNSVQALFTQFDNLLGLLQMNYGSTENKQNRERMYNEAANQVRVLNTILARIKAALNIR